MLNEQISTQFKNLSVELNKTVDDKEILQYNIVEVMKMIKENIILSKYVRFMNPI